MKKPDIKGAVSTKNVRFGGYSTALIGVVLVIAVIINLIFSQLPQSIRTIDLTPGNIYSIGSKTEKMLDQVEKDVTITVLASKDTADQSLTNLLKEYESASKHITVKYVDPTVDINAANKYSNLSTNSLVVSCGSKETTIDISEIYVTDYAAYYSTGKSNTEFDGEGQITSAIASVTSEGGPVIYSITGHGESTISDSLTERVNKMNMTVNTLNLMTSSSIPEDCSLLMIYAPTSDYTEEEAQNVIQYLENGGNVLAITSYTENDLPNFRSILEAYGVQVTDGIVMESANHYYQYPPYVIATIDNSEITEELLSENANILIPNIQGLTVSEGDGVTKTPLLSSSGGAYSKLVNGDTIESFERADGDIGGPFEYAVLAQKDDSASDADTEEAADTKEEAVKSALIVISGASLIDDSITQTFSLGNVDFFLNCLSYLSDSSDAQAAVSIGSKSMSPEYITVPTSQINLFSLLTIILLPAAVLIAGFIIWIRRRKK